MGKKAALASRTARGGLQNEVDVANLFNAWEPVSGRTVATTTAASIVDGWLTALGHTPSRVAKVEADTHNDTHKRDLTVRVITGKRPPSARVHLLSVKLLSSSESSGMNHLQRLTMDSFVRQFNTPADVAQLLRMYTGETPPPESRTGLSDKRRIKAHEFSDSEREKILQWLTTSRTDILNAAFKGPEPQYAPGYILIVKRHRAQPDSVLKTMAHAINVYGEGGVGIATTSFRIGRIILQRKGGGRGATDLQFKCPFNLL